MREFSFCLVQIATQKRTNCKWRTKPSIASLTSINITPYWLVWKQSPTRSEGKRKLWFLQIAAVVDCYHMSQKGLLFIDVKWGNRWFLSYGSLLWFIFNRFLSIELSFTLAYSFVMLQPRPGSVVASNKSFLKFVLELFKIKFVWLLETFQCRWTSVNNVN